MHKFSFFFIAILSFAFVSAQTKTKSADEPDYHADKDVKYAISQILYYCGLEPNFVIVADEEIKSAQAYIHKKQRYVKYNPTFLTRIADSTSTDWAAWSVLAHEIGHHLLGHTIERYRFSHEKELAADKFSGFILNQMGASLEETIACINQEGTPHDTQSHPSMMDRKAAITKGWTESEEIKTNNKCINTFINTESKLLSENYSHQLKFNGDINTYYINDERQIIWYNNYGVAVLLSSLTPFSGKSYAWEFPFEKSRYAIDSKGRVWLIASHGATILVGETKPIKSN